MGYGFWVLVCVHLIAFLRVDMLCRNRVVVLLMIVMVVSVNDRQ